jgi:hypothetical protein
MISLTLAIALVIGTWEITKLPDKITGKQNCYVMHSKDNKVRHIPVAIPETRPRR